jgi:hypothetical protein
VEDESSTKWLLSPLGGFVFGLVLWPLNEIACMLFHEGTTRPH